jgi:DNA-binding NarL/FixJ family response regulator
VIRVVIADDHALVRGGIRQLLATTADIRQVGEAGSGEDLLTVLAQTPCDVVLLDLSMPGSGGLATIVPLSEGFPDLRVIVLSMHNEGPIVARAWGAGVAGYVTKDCAPEVLLTAIRQVAAGERFIDPSLNDALLAAKTGGRGMGAEALSQRERTVLEMIAAGRNLTEIAAWLGVSPKTVSTYKMRLMQKLDIDNNADLVRYAVYLENPLA